MLASAERCCDYQTWHLPGLPDLAFSGAIGLSICQATRLGLGRGKPGLGFCWRLLPDLFGCWKLLSGATTKLPWLPSRPPKRKNSPYPARTKIHQRQKTHPLRYTKSQPPNRAQLAGPGKTPTTERNCDSARLEREPRKSHKNRISAKSNMLTGHLHLVALKRQTSLVLLPLEKKGRKKGSRPLGESQVPSTTRQNMSFTTDCWSKR